MIQDNAALWLVKRKGKVLGPYSKIEIGYLLEKGDLDFLDEVQRPFQRWNFIRDEVAFASIVEEVRRKRSQSEDSLNDEFTVTEAVTIGGMTDGATEKIEGIFPDELTEEISLERKGIEDAEYEDIDEPSSFARKTVEGPVYGYEKDEEIEQLGRSKVLWIVTAIIFLGTLSYAYYQRVLRPSKKNSTTVGTQLPKVKSLLKAGHFEQALNLLKKIKKENPRRIEASKTLGLLLIQMENQTIQGRRYLEEALSLAQGQEDENGILVGIGIADLIEDDLEEARKIFKRVLAQDPLHVAAMLNLSFLSFSEKKYQEALSDLEPILNMPAAPDEAFFFYHLLAYHIWKSQKDKNILKKVLK
ncbi:MAG: hypothetical protein D6797_05210, partial [Bdellovibrio sp.]